MRPFAILAALTILTSLAAAQHPVSGAPSRHVAHSRNAHASTPRHASPLAALPFPFFGDSFNPDDLNSSGNPAASQPPPFLMQALQSMAGSAAGPMGAAMSAPANHGASPNDPLMIELQNGHYVRVNNTAIDGEAQPLAPTKISLPAKSAARRSAIPAPSSSAPALIAANSPAAKLPAAVLLFRDGHSEEVRDYTIANGTLYARGDYYTDGYWNKKIDLATLDVPGTREANAARKVKFVLPQSPNEVITRP